MNINYADSCNFKPIPAITPLDSYWQNGTWKFNMSEISAGAASQPSWIDIILKGNTALTLVNAKEDGLNYLKLFGGTEQLPETYLDTVTLSGGCEQRNLPSGYTQVEYIQSNGTQYIDTGINQTALVKPRIITKYKITVSEDKDWFGGSNDDGGGIIWNIAPNTTRIAYIRWKTQSTRGITFKSGYSVSDLVFLSDFHTLDVGGVEESGVVPIIVDNNLIGNMDSTTTLNWVNHNLLIFRSGRSGQNGTCLFSYFTIYSNDVKVWDGVACRRNSDNVLGMFDLVSQTFFTNAGTGTFTAGADVTVPTPSQPLSIISNNGAIKVSPNLYNRVSNPIEQGTLSGGAPSTSDYRVRTNDYINVVTGNKYTVSSNIENIYVWGFSSGNTPSTVSGNWVSGSGYTFTVPSGIVKIKLVFANSMGSTLTIVPSDVSWVMLEAGSTVTQYRPYGQIYTDGTVETVTDSNGLTASAERLLAIGDYKDTQEVLTGSVTRNVGIKVLDGSENWQAGSTGRYYLSINDQYLKDTYTPLCTHFPISTNAAGTGDMTTPDTLALYTGSVNVYQIYAYPSTATADGLNNWKQYLATQYANGTPVIIIYPASSATTETVTGQFLSKSPVTQTAGSISNLPIAITESSHTTPTPQQPLQINCNNGVLKLSPNLFNLATRIVGYYISETGVITAEQNIAYSALIPVKPNTYYTYSGHSYGGNKRLHAYDSSGNWIQQINYASVPSSDPQVDFSVSGQTPANCSYVRISGAKADTSVQIELGQTATPYRPYGQIYVDGTTETVNIHSKNLFNSTPYKTGYYIDASGNEQVATQYQDEYIIRQAIVQPSTAYTISFVCTLGGYTQRFHAYDKNGNWISQITAQSPSVGNTVEYAFTTPSNCKYVRQGGRNQSNYQIEQGSTATTYEPYFDGGQATAENLLKVGTYQDIQSVLDGEVTRNVGVKVLDGSEDWVNSSIVYYGIAKSNLNTNIAAYSTAIICTHYAASATSGVQNTIWVGTNNVNWLVNETFSTIQEWKTYLADQYANGTPVIVVYPLATATTETVTAQPLTIQEGTNIVSITQASMDNLELEVSYKAGVAVTITEIENAQLDNSVEVTING